MCPRMLRAIILVQRCSKCRKHGKRPIPPNCGQNESLPLCLGMQQKGCCYARGELTLCILGVSCVRSNLLRSFRGALRIGENASSARRSSKCVVAYNRFCLGPIHCGGCRSSEGTRCHDRSNRSIIDALVPSAYPLDTDTESGADEWQLTTILGRSERRDRKESGRSGYGKADCDSRPYAALLPFPIGTVDWESAPRRLRTVRPLVGAIAPFNNSNDTVSQITRSSSAYPYGPPAPAWIVNQQIDRRVNPDDPARLLW
jgi:hypothetical protein